MSIETTYWESLDQNYKGQTYHKCANILTFKLVAHTSSYLELAQKIMILQRTNT